MESTRQIIAASLLALGCFLSLTSALGVLRMPDFFTRLHPAGKSDTLTQTLILVALLVDPHGVDYGDPTIAIKLVLITALLYITAPTSTHAIARAAHVDGVEPWSNESSSATSTEEGADAR